tara:strand:+ start:1521 stop:2549 length:1029 start_codon:yes stop_codon:yes gene_type:complete
MFKTNLFLLLILLYLPLSSLSKDFTYKQDNYEIILEFNENKIESIRFIYFEEDQKHFGIIKYKDDEIDINISTNQITFDQLKKYFPKPQKNNKLSKKINFNWEISDLIISQNYSLKSNKLNFIYDKGFQSMNFHDDNKEFEFAIIPSDDGKKIVMTSKNAGQFFYAQKITKNMIGGALMGEGYFRKFDDYDLNIKVKDFSINKNAKYYDLIFTSRLLDIFSILKNNQDEFNYLEIPISKRGKKFTFDHAIMLGGTVAFSFKGEAHPLNKTAYVNGTYGPLYLFEQNFKNIPFLNEIFGKNVEESLIAADFKVKKNGNKTEFIFNPLSILTPGKTRNFFDIWE